MQVVINSDFYWVFLFKKTHLNPNYKVEGHLGQTSEKYNSMGSYF